MLDDNNRLEAIKLSVKLSNQLTTMALALLSIEIAVATFVLSTYKAPNEYVMVTASAFVFLIASIILGGKGISRSGSEGFRGSWNFEAGRPYFNAQAFSGLIGLVLLAASVFVVGEQKANLLETRIGDLEREIGQLTERMDRLSAEQSVLGEEVRDAGRESRDDGQDLFEEAGDC